MLAENDIIKRESGPERFLPEYFILSRERISTLIKGPFCCKKKRYPILLKAVYKTLILN